MGDVKLARADGSAESAPDIAIIGDQVTIHPGQDRLSNAVSERRLLEHMPRFRESPLDFLRDVSLHVSGTGWRAYDNYIGQPIFYNGFTENMINNVIGTPLLIAKIEELTAKRLIVEEKSGFFGIGAEVETNKIKRRQQLQQQLQDVVRDMLNNMIARLESKTFIRGAYYLATGLLTRAYHQGIHVSSEEVLRLRAVAEEAAKKKQSIVFLPCHRSHIDYVSLQLICYRLGIALPTVVAGDNLGFIGLKQFLQSAGAMWIRRSFGGDALYSAVTQSYIETLLRMGFNLEAFVEGGRSRTGKLLPPKFGILSYVLDAVLSGRVEDTIICPVSTQYDKVLETESYISELLGTPKKKENIVDFLSSSSVLSLRLGRVDVRFHEPWSLKRWITEQQTRFIQQPSNDDTAASRRIRLLRTLGYRVLADINAVSVVMPTAIIGTVLLTLRGRGVGKAELIRRCKWLSDHVRAKGGRVAHLSGASIPDVIDRALEVMGPGLVGRVEGLAEETFYAVDRFQLSIYRNMTIHLFVSEALLCAGMYTRVKQGGGPANQKITYDELYTQVLFLSQLFQYEFIFPTEGFATNLQQTLESLEADEVLKLSRDNEGGIIMAELSQKERDSGRENYDFYTFMIWPFVEGTWLAAVSLIMLTPPRNSSENAWIELKKAQDMAQLFGKTLYHQGDLSYYEAVNKEVLGRSYERFIDEGIILIARSKEPGIPPKIKLATEWTPQRDDLGNIKHEGKLWDFAEMIAKSRREGKNRRDGATVSTRVLGLADRIGAELYAVAASAVPAKDIAPQPKKKRGKEMKSRSRL